MVKLKKNNNIQGFFDIEKCLVEGKKKKEPNFNSTPKVEASLKLAP
jgi:hypothetical protein